MSHIHITRVTIVATRQVATKTAYKSIAVLLSIAGLTKNINHC
jgi:hypothetical protein